MPATFGGSGHIVMAHIVMAHIVMAHTVMALPAMFGAVAMVMGGVEDLWPKWSNKGQVAAVGTCYNI